MLSISKPMGAGQAEKYYYAEDQFLGKEAGLEIYGKTAEALGLNQGDKLTKEQLSNLLAGKNMQGEQVREIGKNGEQRAMIDMTFSAPKSASILSTVDTKVTELHIQAVNNVMAKVEKEYAECRIGKNRDAVPTGNMAWFRGDHMVSRELDMQLHSHVGVMNMTEGPDGKIRALNNIKLYQDQLYLGRAYRAEFASLLQENNYAIEITDRKNSFFEIKGVDKAIIQETSTRRGQIEEKMNDPAYRTKIAEQYPNARRGKQYEIAALGTRAPKDHSATREDIEAHWEEIYQSKGWTGEKILEAAKAAGLEKQPEMSVLDKTSTSPQEKMIERGQISAESQTGPKNPAYVPTMHLGNGYKFSSEKGLSQQIKSGKMTIEFNLTGPNQGGRTVTSRVGNYFDSHKTDINGDTTRTTGITKDGLTRIIDKQDVSTESQPGPKSEQGHMPPRVTFDEKDKGAFERVLIADGKEATPRDYLKVAAGIVTESESVFTRKDVENEALRLSFGKYDTKTVTGAFDSLKKEGWIKELDTIQQGGASREVFSTREMIQVEKEIISMVRASKDQYKPSMTKEQAGEFLRANEEAQGWKLTAGQNKAVMTVLTNPNRVNIIQGDAGVGKTTFSEQIKAINGAISQGAKDKGREVIGIGFTGKAAAELEGVGIKSSTIDSFLLKDIRFYEPGQKIESHGNTMNIARGSILIMDEASMTGSKHMHQILQLAEQGDLKLVIQGDKKQLSAISAGRMFEVLQKEGGVGTVELTEILRQREGSHAYEVVQGHTKAIAAASAVEPGPERVKAQQAAVASTVDRMKAQGNFHQIGKIKDLQKAVVGAYLDKSEQGSTVILADRNADRKALNDQVREKFVAGGKVEQGQTHQVLASAGLGTAESHMANRYEKGMKITLSEGVSNSITSGFEGTVVSHDSHGNFLTVQNDKTGKTERINVAAHGGKINAFTLEERNFGKGDKIVFLKNDKKLGVLNGNIGEIQSIDDRGNVTAKVHGIDKPVTFNLDGKAGQEKGDAKLNYNYLDQGYCVTVHKSQGTTYDHAIMYHNSEHGAGSLRSLYVGLSRAKESFKVFTDSAKAFIAQASLDVQKTSTTDYTKQIRDDELGLKHQDKDQAKAQPEAAKIEAHDHKEQTGHKHDEAHKEHHQGPTALGADSKIEQAEQAKTQTETSKGIEKTSQSDHGKAEQSKTSEKHQERTDSKQEHGRQQSDRGQDLENEISL